MSVSCTRLVRIKHRAVPPGLVWSPHTYCGFFYLCDLAELTGKMQMEGSGRKAIASSYVRVMLMLPHGLKGRNYPGGSDNWCVGPGRSEITQIRVRMDIAVRTAAGEEMSNSAFGTGFVANMQLVKFETVCSAWRGKKRIERFSLIEQYPHIHLCLNEDGSYAKIACDRVIKNYTECIKVDKNRWFVYTPHALSFMHKNIYMYIFLLWSFPCS